jgi:hypothetical protein
LDTALVLDNKAIKLKPSSWFYRLKIDILEKQHKYKEAIETANALFDVLQKNAKEEGWSAETLRITTETNKTRIELLKMKLNELGGIIPG